MWVAREDQLPVMNELLTANPALGFCADLLVRAGAMVMFSEVTEVRDGIDQLTARAIDADVAQALIREMDWYDGYLEQGLAVCWSASTVFPPVFSYLHPQCGPCLERVPVENILYS